MNTDKLTTYAGLIAVMAGALHESGVYPDETGIIAALAAAVWAFYTNRLDRTFLK